MHSCQLILDPPDDGAWNMALDEALLESAKSEGRASLRFYSWREPTLSLGYFQAHADRIGHVASTGCRMARRASGGGAILHDAEITYSIALPQSHPAAAGADTLYGALHRSLIEVLAQFGVKAALAEVASAPRTAPEPFLCFQRRTNGDVLVGPNKVAGSAQRRHQRAVLQHGSVLVRRSAYAPELPGICDLTADRIDIDSLRTRWLDHIGKELELRLVTQPLPPSICDAATKIVEKFKSEAWNLRR
jgi:lipoate-protein ligase A